MAPIHPRLISVCWVKGRMQEPAPGALGRALPLRLGEHAPSEGRRLDALAGRASSACFLVPGNHKFIFWESHVFCDLHFLTLGLGTCFKETEWFSLKNFFFFF